MTQLKFENILETELAGAPGTEVVVSHVVLPPNITLPLHWHPGEEFVYILEGSATLVQEGKEDQTFTKGGVGVVPYKQIHTARTGEEGVTLVAFRVHEQGQPERFLVE